jgi:23S rRNA (uridine2552-2'-O)-methyltransferase
MQAADLAGPAGRVVGIDLTPVNVSLPAHVSVHTKDVFELVADPGAWLGQEFDVVLSDMAPATTGSRGVDAARSHNLCEAALAIARAVLRPGGVFVCKIFQGEDFKSFIADVKTGFSECKAFKPQSSRKASREIYIIGKGKTGGPHVRSQ